MLFFLGGVLRLQLLILLSRHCVVAEPPLGQAVVLEEVLDGVGTRAGRQKNGGSSPPGPCLAYVPRRRHTLPLALVVLPLLETSRGAFASRLIVLRLRALSAIEKCAHGVLVGGMVGGHVKQLYGGSRAFTPELMD